MKKMTKVIIILILVGIIGVIGYNALPQEMTDRFNPLASEEVIYVQINDEPTHTDHRYRYTLTGYTKEGGKQTITFSTSAVLKKYAFLKVNAKGAYVRTWEEVQSAELPAKIQEKLKK
ncbi:YxeA family protein [Salibacterium sp. K-3]